MQFCRLHHGLGLPNEAHVKVHPHIRWVNTEVKAARKVHCLASSNRKVLQWGEDPGEGLHDGDDDGDDDGVSLIESGKVVGRKEVDQEIPVTWGYMMKDGELVEDSGALGLEMRWYSLRRTGRSAKSTIKYLDAFIPSLPLLRDKEGNEHKRQFSLWFPQKRINAWNPRTGKMGKRTVNYADGGRLFIECTMDNAMYKLALAAPGIVSFTDINGAAKWIPNPCDEAIIRNIWEWMWRIEDITEEDYNSQQSGDPVVRDPALFEEELNKDPGDVGVDLVEVAELMSRGESIKENAEDFLLAKKVKQDMEGQRKISRNERNRERRRSSRDEGSRSFDRRTPDNRDVQQREESPPRSPEQEESYRLWKQQRGPYKVPVQQEEQRRQGSQSWRQRSSSSPSRSRSRRRSDDRSGVSRSWKPASEDDEWGTWGRDKGGRSRDSGWGDSRGRVGRGRSGRRSSPRERSRGNRFRDPAPSPSAGWAESDNIDENESILRLFEDLEPDPPGMRVSEEGKASRADEWQGEEDVDATNLFVDKAPDSKEEEKEGRDLAWTWNDALSDRIDVIGKALKEKTRGGKEDDAHGMDSDDDGLNLEWKDLGVEDDVESGGSSEYGWGGKKDGSSKEKVDLGLVEDMDFQEDQKRREAPKQRRGRRDRRGGSGVPVSDEFPEPQTEEAMETGDQEEQRVSGEDATQSVGIAKGDAVSVVSGAFQEFDGVVISDGEGVRAKVELNIFGRPTVVEIEGEALKRKEE